MTEIKLTKRYPNSRIEDITDAYMRGWNDALDAVQYGKFHTADTPQTDYPCNTCANKGDHDGECQNCVADSAPIRWETPSHYKPKQGTDCTEVEPTTEDCSMVADNENCIDCVHFEQCTTNGWTDCHYMPIADCSWK